MKRKFTLLIAALALLTMIVQPGRAWGQATVGTTMWAEDFSGYANNAVPNGEITNAHDGTTVYGDATITYTCANGGSTTQVYTSGGPNGNNNLLISKGNGTFTVNGIPTGDATELTVTYAKSGSGVLNISTSTTDVTISDSDSGATITTNGASTIEITFKNTGSSNLRIDDIEITVKTAGGGGDLEDSDLAIVDDPVVLNFNLYPTAIAQTVTYTTSSTGAVTVSESEYVTTSVSGYTITVTPVAVTPSAQTITVSQAADATYAAGSATFTVNVTNSAPTVTVTYHANGGEGENIVATPYQGSDYTVANNTFTKSGYAFTKWHTNAAGTGGTDYDPGDVIESINADIDLYAQWEESSETVDVLNYAFTGITGTGYSAWSNKTGASGAVYAGRSGGDHNSIQLNSTSPNGIVSTASGGKFTKVVVSWNSSTANNRSVQVYGKTTAYDGSSDLYDNDKRGTLLGTITNGTSTELTISGDYNYIGIKNPGSAIYMDEVRITWVAASGDVVATPAIIPNGGNFWDSQEVSITCATDGATIYYTTDGTDPTSESSVYSAPFTITANTTVKAFAVKTDMTDSEIATAEFTKATPMTVAQALAATPQNNVYVSGIISGITEVNTSYHNATYTISDDGTQSGQMTVFRGRYLNNTDFTATDQIQVGDIVVVYGNLSTYQEVNQLAQGNYLVSLERPAAPVATPTFNPEAGVYTESQNVEISCETEGSTIYYTTDGTEPTNTSTEYTGAISVTETTTIKAIAIKNSDASTVATANYYICSQENPYTVTEALAFAEYQYPANGIYVHGIVSTAPTQAPTNNGELTYYISVDGQATNQLQVYKGKGLNNAAFTAQDDIQVGDIVTVYGNVKIYNSIKEFDAGNYLVSFYREPVLETENVNIACDATEGVITYTVTNPASDGNLTAEITDGNEGYWLTLGTIGANVPFTCTANTGAERTATVTLTYTYNTTETVTATAVVTQAAYVAPVASITVDPATVNAPAAETDGTLTVTYTDIATDLGANIFWYTDNTGTETTTEPEWISADIDDITLNVEYLIDANTGDARSAYFKVYGLDTNANDVYSDLVTINQAAGSTPPTPGQYDWVLTSLANLTSDDVFIIVGDNGDTYAMANNNGSSAPTAEAVTIENGAITETVADNIQWNLSTSDDGYMFYPNGTTETWLYCTNTNNGVKVGTGDAKHFTLSDNGYITTSETTDQRYIGIYNSQDWRCYTSEGGNIANQTFAFYKRVPASTEPSITLNQYTYNLNSEGGNAELLVTYKNMPTDPQAVVIFYESDGETELTENPTWITATINANGNVDGHIDANDGDARSAYFKVKGIDADGNDVYSGLVTVNQAAYTLSIVFETTSLDIEAGGEQDRIISFEYQGLGENPTFEVRTYDVTGETPTTYDWLTTSITQGHKVSINVAENTGDARSAYFKVYGENGTVNTESNLVTINQAAAGVTYTLVETDDDIEPGLHYIIVGIGTDNKYYAMAEQRTNNRGEVLVTATGNTIAEVSGIHEFVISGDETNLYTIYDESDIVSSNVSSNGYLYAAGANSNNYLKTYPSVDNRGQWTININETTHKASIVANMTGRNTLRYNYGSGVFSCYTGGQQDIYLYKKNNDTDPVYYSPTIVNKDVEATAASPYIVQPYEILTGNITNTSGSANALIVKDGGEIVTTNNVLATYEKNITEPTAWYPDAAADGWYTISSPVGTVAINSVEGLTADPVGNVPQYDLFSYNEPNMMWYNAQGTAHSFTQLKVGMGYLYAKASISDPIGFKGNTNVNDVPLILTHEASGDMAGFNLIGNPFGQSITMDNIDGAEFSGGYVLTNNGTWKTTVDAKIKPCQGFMVQVDEGISIIINRVPSSKSRANHDYLAFTVSNSEFEDVTYAMFSNGIGLNKISHRNSQIPMVYIQQNNKDYAIATMDDNTQAFNLNFKAMTTGQYTLSFDAKGKYSYLHVIDRLTGEDIDMLLDGEYTFIGSPRDNENRFIVKLDYNANIDELEVSDSFVYQYGSDIIVNGNGELQVFDVTGRMVMNTKINGIQTVNVPATGMYIFRMVGESVQTQKIVVR
ncbi:MAG: chitobiase/beta-hexosaminidase C-terminal domain-containing protein [Bacteroidales bacterium]|nr:chitobiase/beta-hexosaminidase C-terminal domain-containing protein [Bacteroidales bacterium]